MPVSPRPSFESTGHYHEPVHQFLDDHAITYYVINPVVPYEANKTGLRKVKTDKIDAYHLGELYYKEDLEAFQKKTEQYLDLRQLTRQHSALTDRYVEINYSSKLQSIIFSRNIVMSSVIFVASYR
ncbi:hypothetical protein GCM10007063_33330 [Lentibacillus kapialis]|uniref:Transposase IS110-like N-terminal domain-containing protein n=1 Tax=Lentibacillus kapialis TaxID=340214 RepID=A0A917V1D7_9BACI|nr:hypothetical protein GCM10007063_33330 [Lentibacillus kapialis]